MRGVSSLITSLPTFMGSFSFFGDELHMIGHGLGHMVSNLIDYRHSKRFMKKGARQYSLRSIHNSVKRILLGK